MGKATWEVSKDEWNTAFNGIRMTARAHGLDVNHHDVATFIEHQADVTANLFAQTRYLSNKLNEAI